MPKVKKSDKKIQDFSMVFEKGAAPKRAVSLLDIMDDFIYDTYNRSKEDMEHSYDGKLTPAFHPSQIAKEVCARKMVLEYMGAEFEEETKFHSPELLRIFHNGSGVHERIQSYMAGLEEYTKGKAKLIGRWKCTKCGELYGYAGEGKKPYPEYWVGRPEKCICGAWKGLIVYKEVGLEIPELRVTGKADGVLEWKDKRWVVEIKSMNPFQFMKLQAPPQYYIPQPNIYCKAIEMAGMEIDGIIWIFESKDNQNWRDFTTIYDPKLIKPQIDLLEKVNEHINKNKLPERLPEKSKECKLCAYKKICSTNVTFKPAI